MIGRHMAGAQNAGSGLTRSALENRRVLGVIAGFGAVTLGEWVLGTSVAVHAYQVGGALAVGLVGFRFAPAALAGLWTTRLADSAMRHRVLSLTAAARAATTAVAAIALVLGLPFGVVIVLVWLDAAAGSGYRPAQAALLPALARSPGELTAATALVSNVKSSGQLIGALLGGLLVAGLPVAVAVACAALLYAVAIMTTMGGRPSYSFATRPIGMSALHAGVGSLRESREARSIFVYSCLRSLVRGLWLALAVVASVRFLSLGPSGFGDLMAAAAAGALVAIVVTARLVGNSRLAGWFAVGLLLCGLPIVGTSLSSSAVPALLLMVAWGIGMSVSDVGAQTLLNRIVPGSSIGSLTGVMESGKLLIEGSGSLVAPLLLVVFGSRGGVFIAGAVVPIVVLAGSRSFARIDDRAVARLEVLELLRWVPFFTPLRVDALEGIAARLRLEHTPAGTEIVRQGDIGAHRWFLVAKGELVVEVDGFLVGELRRGNQFGERALLHGVARSATVRAATDVALYALEREDFLAAVAGVELDEAGRALPARPEQVDPATALAHAPLLQSLQPAVISDLVQQSRVHEVHAGTAIVTSGENDDTYHVLLSGRAQVLVDGVARRGLHPGDAFGEIAVLHRIARTATVIASDPSEVLTVDGEVIRAAVRGRGGALAALAS
jgi:CRP-like cAMP-binding protein